MTPEELREQFRKESNEPWVNLDLNVEYVEWLEKKVIEQYYKGYSDGITGAQSEPGN